MNDSNEKLVTRILLITGMSGAGKSTAIKMLEDMGYETFDNMPLSLLPNLLPVTDVNDIDNRPNALAADVDVRTRDFTAKGFLEDIKSLLSRDDLRVQIVYFDCDDDVLAKRYTETRRRHPLAEERPLIDGILLERSLVGPLRDHADLLIDTSHYSIPDLRQILDGNFRLGSDPMLSLMLTSFAFRRGLPREADLVFDVRFLSNPHYDDRLRLLTGQDASVGAFVADDPAFHTFFENLATMILSLIPYYEREGKTYLTIAVGCTGGRHRSVYIIEQLSNRLNANGYSASVCHRDI